MPTNRALAFRAPLILLLAIIADSAQGGEPAALQHPTKQLATEKVPAAKFDARQVIESLVSQNKRPEQSDWRRPNFPKDFKWTEQERCWKTILTLMNHMESAWPELVAHLDDERYCISIENLAFDVHKNWTVGDVCQELVGRTLAEPYYSQFAPEALDALNLHRELRSFPPRSMTKERAIALKEWCDARGKKRLYEMQLDACQEVSGRLGSRDILPDLESKTRAQWVASISKLSELMSNDKTPRLFKRFGAEEILPCRDESEEKDPFGEGPCS